MSRLFASASAEYLTVTSAPVTGYPLSMACWFYPTEGTVYKGLVMLRQLGDDSDSHQIAIINTTALIIAKSAAGTSNAASTTAASVTDTWQHAAGVFASATSRAAYLNGGNKGTSATSRVPAVLGETFIGRGSSGGAFYMEGMIAEVGIWNVALTDADVASLAKGYSPLLIRPEGLVTYVPLIRDNDKDLIGGLSFSVNGTPEVSTHTRVFYPSSPIISSTGGGAPPAGGAFINTAYASALPKLRANL